GLLGEQQNPRSSSFRKWLTPEQFADQFGVSDSDIAKITAWMRSQGFDIIAVGRGRRFIAFNATEQHIETALQTEIHHFRINGELHFANTTEPSVPAAIQPLVLGFTGLDDFGPKPTGRFKTFKPNYTGSGGGHNVTPGDLAIIYDVVPIYQAGYTGAGQTIAVMGQSDIKLSDISDFQGIFGVPYNLPQVVLVPGSNDPGFKSGDEGESDMDLQYAGGIAPGAQLLFVYSTSVFNSVTYTIDQALARVVSLSYAACEQQVESTGAQTLQNLAQQANAQGITWITAAGDDGAAMCDTTTATHGLSVSAEAAVPEITSVGGTMFTDNSSQYWSFENSANDSSALSYIPETVWNESTPTELSAGGGGFSTFFARPPWQVGPYLLSAGGARGVPDVSLTAAHNDDPYAVITEGQPKQVGGTSASTPVFAGIITLLNEYLGTNGLGNINPSLYWMFQTTPVAFHDIVTGGNAVPCEPGSPDCTVQDYVGYGAAPGWDPASGLGSVDTTQMFNNWSAGAGLPQIGSVVNGASLTGTGLSPGLIFTIFGSALGPLSGLTLQLDPTGKVSNYLANIVVTVAGVPAPLLYVGPGQINAVAPYEIANAIGESVTVQVYDGEQASNSVDVPVVATAPAIFSLGNGQGAILNQNGSVNGPNNPAARGSYIQIYGTGEGQINPAGVDGLIASGSAASLPHPVASLTVTIGGAPANVGYAGTAPDSFEGFLQVNALVPNSVGSGNQPVILNAGGVTSTPLNVFVQ
ncbi:MAG: S8 family serine peptidase, partial [Bryobacterales bacterium]|nr:S8 family serine peptidase [Bryobacterales bacterium]